MVFTHEKMCEHLPLLYISWRQVIVFSVSGSKLENLLYVTSPQKQETEFSLVLKDSDTESENLRSLIRFSVSDSQKSDSLKDVSL